VSHSILFFEVKNFEVCVGRPELFKYGRPRARSVSMVLLMRISGNKSH